MQRSYWATERGAYHADTEGHKVVVRQNRLGHTRLRSVRSASVSLRVNIASEIASGEPYCACHIHTWIQTYENSAKHKKLKRNEFGYQARESFHGNTLNQMLNSL
jgi:hypothetical protein